MSLPSEDVISLPDSGPLACTRSLETGLISREAMVTAPPWGVIKSEREIRAKCNYLMLLLSVLRRAQAKPVIPTPVPVSWRPQQGTPPQEGTRGRGHSWGWKEQGMSQGGVGRGY